MKSLVQLKSLLTLFAVCGVSACSLSDLVKIDQPEEGRNLEFDAVNTVSGGIGLYHTSLDLLRTSFSSASRSVGIFTDELASRPSSSLEYRENDLSLDARIRQVNIHGHTSLPFPPYYSVHTARINAQQSRDILSQFSSDSLTEYIGAAHIVEAYAILLFAENLCSGVPLTQVRFNRDIEYTPGFSTQELFAAAVSHFDTAISLLDSDSDLSKLAHIGKARGSLGLNNLVEANEAIKDIAPSFRYNLVYSGTAVPATGTISNAFWTSTSSGVGQANINSLEVLANDGNTGKVWYSRAPVEMDPRVPVTTVSSGGGLSIAAIARQQKYIGGAVQFPLASGLEADLIRAEYLLSIDDPSWIDVINNLRATVGLGDLVAPANKADAVEMIFDERASWFYLQATRLGDMRRLVRYYGKSTFNVYPSGPYSRGGLVTTRYGEATVFTPDESEYSHNYRYQGCDHVNP